MGYGYREIEVVCRAYTEKEQMECIHFEKHNDDDKAAYGVYYGDKNMSFEEYCKHKNEYCRYRYDEDGICKKPLGE